MWKVDKEGWNKNGVSMRVIAKSPPKQGTFLCGVISHIDWQKPSTEIKNKWHLICLYISTHQPIYFDFTDDSRYILDLVICISQLMII